MATKTIEAPTETLSATRQGRFSWISHAIKGHAKEYGATFATEFTVLASQLLVYKLAAHFLGKDGFSEYAVARRTISLIYPVALLGMGVALPRYIAHASGSDEMSRSRRYLAAAAYLVLGALTLCLLLMNLFAKLFAALFFGSPEYSVLVPAISLMLVGLALHALAYGYFRGHLDMRRANTLQLLNLGLLPVITFTLINSRLQTTLWVLGIFHTLVAFGSLSLTNMRHFHAKVSEVSELTRYGIQRVPGEFFQVALLALPPIFAAHRGTIRDAGSISFGISVVSMVASVFSPVGLVLLPKASRMFATGAITEARLHVQQIVGLTVIVSLAITSLLWVFAPSLVSLMLGPGFEYVTKSVKIFLWAAVPFCLFYVLRGVIDAFHRNGINSRNLAFAFVLFLLLEELGRLLPTDFSISLAPFLVSISFLAFLTVNEIRKIFTKSRSTEPFDPLNPHEGSLIVP